MALTAGSGPFGPDSSGRFNFDRPDHVVYVEPFPRRVRAVRDGQTVLDSDEVLLVHETGSLPHYAFPRGDVHVDAEDEPHASDYVTVNWDAVDAWFEEDERVEVHPRDPYHRIDSFATSRRVVVSIAGVEVAASTRAVGLYETGLAVQFYLPRADVRVELLEASHTLTECPYKGTARHWSARIDGVLVDDVAWGYDVGVRREAERVRGLIAFYAGRVDIDVGG